MRPELRINLAIGEKKFIKHYLCVCCVEGFELNRNYKDESFVHSALTVL